MVILIPNASVLSLSQLQCSTVSPSQPRLSAGDAKRSSIRLIFSVVSKCLNFDFTSSLVDQNVMNMLFF